MATPWLSTLRLHQWSKNLLLFVPLAASHKWANLSLVTDVSLGFLAFGLVASGGYVLNDLMDLAADRSHPRKRNRPLASGALSPRQGWILMLLLIAAGLSVATLLPQAFAIVLAVYLVTSVSYSLVLKSWVMVDVIVLAALYTLRVIAGGAVGGIDLSFWLLAFSIFVFLSLALVKRCAELSTLVKTNRKAMRGRAYRVSDLRLLQQMGTASGYVSVLVLALYVNSAQVVQHYSHPQVMWLLCPLILYWVSHLWLVTGRHEMHDDPLVFAIRDRASQIVVLMVMGVIVLAL